MNKIVMMNDKDIPKKLRELGGYNDFPPNWKEITEAEFSRSDFFIYSPPYKDHRQIEFEGHFPSFQLYIYDSGSGYAIMTDWENRRIRYFKFALCEHEYGQDEGGYMFEHIYTCKKCGHQMRYDSSG